MAFIASFFETWLARYRSRQIDEKLIKDWKKAQKEKEAKLLLLGNDPVKLKLIEEFKLCFSSCPDSDNQRQSTTSYSAAHSETASFIEIQFPFKTINFRLLSFRTKESERKFIHYFENVLALVFCIPISNYDQGKVMYATVAKNSFQESVEEFDAICNKSEFFHTSIIVLLTGKSLFEEKLQTKPLTDFFTEYTGKQEYTPAAAYTQHWFQAKNKSSTRSIFARFVNETEPEFMQTVFDTTSDVIKANLIRANDRIVLN